MSGFYEDERIRHKNRKFGYENKYGHRVDEAGEVTVQCASCQTEFGSTKHDPKILAETPCPECRKKTLKILA